MEVKITKSEIPIIWIDTSIINHMTMWKFKLNKLDGDLEEKISKLYNAIYTNTRKGKLICPLAEQDEEIWVERDKWFDVIRKLSLSIKTKAPLDIEHNQLKYFMKAYVNGDTTVTLKYTDAFYSDPVHELKDILKSPVFIDIKRNIPFGKEYQKNLKKSIYQAMEEQRKKNVEANVTFDQQIREEYIGELQALFILQRQFMSGQFKDDNDQLNATCGAINLNEQLVLWESLTGKAMDYKGLIGFYKSVHHKSMPFSNISCNLYACIMTAKQPIRSGDVMDIKHASTFLPFSNMYITDRAISAFLKKRGFDKLYNTTVCYLGDTSVINDFFSKL
ncbi:MAG: hypothetical protein JW983_04720 [Elusimicrobia bacterium]|nr:hypothetical protein [Elusimicrobiota bacterium]